MLRHHLEDHSSFKDVDSTAVIGAAFLSTDEKWTRINPAVTALLGYSEEQLLGHSFCKLVYKEDMEIYSGMIRTLNESELYFLDHEIRLNHQDGTPVPLLLRLTLISNPTGSSTLLHC